MKPTLAADQLRRHLIQYLTTTYGLTNPAVNAALGSFFTDPDSGVVKGPYLRIRTPFRSAEDGWQRELDWLPAGFTPHRHQALAWRRLTSKHTPPQPTLVTTGTGSGKTESFLYPVLDHCRRHHEVPGVKAILLYPMNALATDQADRLNELLQDDALSSVTAGLFIGDTAATTYNRILTDRVDIRRTPPDVLITNYKMLDLLLQRPADAPLWADSSLTYVVIDEFHSYDGAQGTDVAMLLRRLSAVTGRGSRICPVATSATLATGTDDPGEAIRRVATTVFGVEFDADSVITEDRLQPQEFIREPEDSFDAYLAVPSPQALADAGDPFTDPDALANIAELVVGVRDPNPTELGRRLRCHPLTVAVLAPMTDGTPHGYADIFTENQIGLLYGWRQDFKHRPELVAEALSRFVALLSAARDPENPGRPLLHVELHLWLRAVNRVIRHIGHQPRFAWYGDNRDTEASYRPEVALPAIACRHCGRDGWMALAPEVDAEKLHTDPDKIYHSVGRRTRGRLRALMAALPKEVEEFHDGSSPIRALDDHGLLHTFNGSRDRAAVDRVDDLHAEANESGRVPVLVELGDDKAALAERCPACGLDNGIRYVGTGIATLASVVVTELFTQSLEASDAKKTLVFNDSVQDAAHRAGFLSARSQGFSLRSLLARQLTEDEPKTLDHLMADAVTGLVEADALSAVVPAELHDDPAVAQLLAGDSGGSAVAWQLIADRIAFATALEFGLRSRSGRTLELTQTVAAEVDMTDPARIAQIAREALLNCRAELPLTLPDDRELVTHVRGVLERLRTRGAIKHRWLTNWLHQAGRYRWAVWGGRPGGMPAFPDGVSAPEFLLDGDPGGRGTYHAVTSARGGWYVEWTRRSLELAEPTARAYLPALLTALAAHELIAARPTEKDGITVYGLTPGHINVHALAESDLPDSQLGCTTCSWRQTLPPQRRDDWLHAPCPRYRCTGRLTRRPEVLRDDYYRRMYRTAAPFRVLAAEHTGTLTREQRETAEAGFRRGTELTDPNTLSATSTLELGIDIGALSAVVLAGMPPAPAALVQRSGRAGRSTGNALVVTIAGRRPRDRHFFAAPEMMLAGQITPPDSFLSAVEILRRQYVAFLLDKVGRDLLPQVSPLPRRASGLFGTLGWLNQFRQVAQWNGAEYVAEFLALFGDDIDDRAREQLREFAQIGLEHKVKVVEQTWELQRVELRDRLDAVQRAESELTDTDRDQKLLKRQLVAELRGIRKLLGDMGAASAHSTLVEHGLLPNYALHDGATILEATLTRQSETPDGDRRYDTELREYRRPARVALTEIAPGSVYYVRGYRHRVNGLDIGTDRHPKIKPWRVCPSCGHVRTIQADQDTSACPSCRGRAISDSGQLFDVLVPTKVMSDDRQDDAHIRDESEDREIVQYNQVDAVDIGHIETAFRHTGATFGADFSRTATVRRFNLGTSRPDRQDKIDFAGDRKQVNPFWVCTACGGAATDGDPAGRTTSNSSTTITNHKADRNRRHHRSWCPRRISNTGHRPIILAHELTTEALRLLLPISVLQAAEKLASFEAALMLGVTARYGGDPAHLTTITAHMPDQQTGRVRNFVVLVDTLPGGTGYLHRLSEPDQLQAVLRDARDRVRACHCPVRQACHRCLLAHTRERNYDLVSRDEALKLLNELLADWGTEHVSGVNEIPILDLVESELEARFRDKLIDWARDTDGVSMTPVSQAEADLRISTPDGQTRRWRVQMQHTIQGTRPDVLFTRMDTDQPRIALYLDGHRYHATTEYNRLADDADKRNRLHANGAFVFAVTWDDVEAWRESSADRGWPPYKNNAQTKACDIFRNFGGDPAVLGEVVWGNPIDTLIAYLTEPDLGHWRKLATATVSGLLTQPDHRSTSHANGVAERVSLGLTGEPLPPDQPGGVVHTFVARDDNQVRLVVCVDGRRDNAFSAIVLMDDRDEGLSGRRRAWQSWLYWANLVQFLVPAGDGMQLTMRGLPDFDPARLRVSDGTGMIEAWSKMEPVSLTGDDVPGPARPDPSLLPPAIPVPPDQIPPQWREVQDFADSAVQLLLADLAGKVAPPEVGYELSEEGWQAELAWPDVKVAVLTGDDRNRDAAFAAAGWHAKPVDRWTADELHDELSNRRAR